ncbi:MAG: hypothetical protein M5R36_14545 [Deltaproteobacteria bacterium]|nr:hypothetical protein [Deltaproteobacteria bacterium]
MDHSGAASRSHDVPIDPPYQDGDVVRRQYFAATAGNTGIDVAVDQNGVAHIATMLGTVLEHIAVHPDGRRTQEMIDKDGGTRPRIAVDANGAVHVAYVAMDELSLRYAVNADGTWEGETVEVFPRGDVYFGMTVTAGGQPHLIYAWEDSTSDVHYATKSGGSWSIDTIIPSDGKWRAGYSLALGPDGTLHELHSEPDAVSHLWNDASGWHQEVVTYQELFYGTSLAVDAEGYLHGTYALYGSSSLVYVTNKSGTWDEIVVDWCGGEADGDNARLMLDSAGGVHIVYGDTSWNGVRYATNRNGPWEISKFYPPRAFDGLFISAAMGPGDAIHIADYYEDRDGLYYLTNASGEWEKRLLAGGLQFGASKPMADDAGNLHALLVRSHTYELYYGRSDGDTWTIEDLGLPAGGWMEKVLAVGHEGTIHAVFRTADNASVIYAAKASVNGNWDLETLDTGEFESGSLTIVINSLAEPRVAYRKELPEDHIIDAEKVGETWEYDMIDPPAKVGDLILDENENPLIVARQLNYPESDAMFFFHRENGTWTSEIIENSSNSYSQRTTLALGPDGEARVVILDYHDRQYSLYSRPFAGPWESVFSFDWGYYSVDENTLGVDQAGNNHVLYFGDNVTADDRGLVYATDSTGTWDLYDLDIGAVASSALINESVPDFVSAAYTRSKFDGWAIATVAFTNVSASTP